MAKKKQKRKLTINLKKGDAPEIKIRDWGNVILQFKTGKGAHGTKKGKKGYNRKKKHKNEN